MPSPMETLTQFGVPGLIAAMWLVERRASATREKQLTEAHVRLTESRTHLDALLLVVKDNTRAITALEASQRALTQVVERLAQRHDAPRPIDSDHS